MSGVGSGDVGDSSGGGHGVRTGFVTQTHTGDVSWREAIEEGANLNFDFAELYMDGATERTKLDPEAVRSVADGEDIDLLVHLPFVDVEIGSPREGIREASREEQKACIETAAAMGAEKAVLHASSHATPPEWTREDVEPHLLAAIRELDAFGEEHGVKVCVENLPGILFTVHDFDRIFAETNAAMTFDTGHARVDGMDAEDMESFLTEHGDRISHIHVNDARGPSDEHVPTGSGTLDLETALAPVRDGWSGTVSVEVYSFDFDYLELSKRKLDEAL
ncbi:Sugar phosphate isomerase/epimerase [Haladaptatus litoreus]|uniref:Sugar phosphate isomerase/epimerase n=1 Tax=Haladaptatus litoreus TaxID=553468 RepID=A0A1N6YLM9_9EURY|nr:sugar phosphate isomerase/epimerase family protein [Haladaptatus litoreus]SIR15446.1 Sugar phosphate isomerase/epimerase [Haladaptatus litoreus]